MNNPFFSASEGVTTVEALKKESTDTMKMKGMQEIVTNIETRNQSLEGERHPITGVPFKHKEITLPSGEKVEGVFPEFEPVFEAQLDETQYLESDAKQFKECNMQLQEEIKDNEHFKKQFTPEQLKDIEEGDVPSGYVWHHSEDPGKMQLVDKEVHDRTGHTGGRFLWGGGSDFR